MELFDLTKIIFEKPGEYQDITPGEKRKWFFLINRRFSIQFPMQANALQHLKINQAGVVDFWQNFMRKMYSKTPGWMYTKGIKKAKEDKEKKTKISESLVTQYANKMEIDKKSIYDALEFFPEKIQKELKDFEKLTTQK
jgi:hypothetical protein